MIYIFDNFSAFARRGQKNNDPIDGSVEVSIGSDINSKYEHGRSLAEKVREIYNCGYNIVTFKTGGCEPEEEGCFNYETIEVDSLDVYRKYGLQTPTPSPQQ